jgi:hypothetical protein
MVNVVLEKRAVAHILFLCFYFNITFMELDMHRLTCRNGTEQILEQGGSKFIRLRNIS